MYCNPNGGYYEFTGTQNEWVEIYLSLGLNIVLWNYRGYGRSQGYPDMPSLATDGEYVLKHFREYKQIEKIGVHGQSLGGSIAARLGKNTDFIFVDRTFRGLTDVALFNYGKAAYYLYKALGPRESDPVKDYLAATCYKLIACDCEDVMIPNLASLKAGVALALRKNLNIRGTNVYSILDSYAKNRNFAELAECLSSLVRKNSEKEEESPEVDVVGALCNLEILGRSLYKVGKKKEIRLELVLWICMASVWTEQCKAVRIVMEDIQRSLVEFQETQDAQMLRTVYNCLKELLDMEGDEICEDYPSAGMVLPLNCGHNAVFAPYELYLYKVHLKASGLIPR